MTAAGQWLRVHVDGRIVVGQSVQFLRPAAVGIHGPHGLGDPRALVDIFPAVVHDPAVIQHHGAEFADRTAAELFDVRAVRLHAVQHRSHQGSRAAAEHGVFGAGRGEDDLAIRQITRMNVVGVPGRVPAGRLLRLVRRREGDLAKARAVGVHFPNAKPGAGILAKIKEDLPGIQRQADLANEAFSARQTGGGDDGPLRSRPHVVDENPVVGNKPVGTGAVVDVRVVVIGRVGLAFDEREFVEAQGIRIDGRRRRRWRAGQRRAWRRGRCFARSRLGCGRSRNYGGQREGQHG